MLAGFLAAAAGFFAAVLPLRADRRDLDLRERATVAVMATVARAPAVLADPDLLALHVAEHLGRHLEPRLQVRLALAADEQEVRVERLALVGLDPVDEQLLALLDAVLLATH